MTSKRNGNPLLATIFLALAAIPALAQPATQPGRPNFPAQRGQFIIERFRRATADINLSPEQKSKIDGMINQAGDDIQALSPDEGRQKIQAINADVREKILAALTDDQAAKFRDNLQSQRPPNGGGGGPGGFNNTPGRPGPRGMDNAPAAQETNAGPIRVQDTLQRLNESLATLDLSPDQKTKVRAIVDDNTKQITDLRDQMFSGAVQPADAREEFPKLFASMRDQLADVLTSDQQIKLRDAIQSRYDRDTKAATSNTPPTPATKPAMTMMKTDPFSNDSPPNQPEGKPAPAHLQATVSPDIQPAVGDAAPDFNLETLSGRNVQLSSFKGKPLVIEFGSYSSPSFRQRAAKFDELARQYGNRANFLIIYTAEAHPAGGWEVDRNRDEGIRIPKAADLTERKSEAKQAKQLLKIVVPIATDDMKDKTANDYSAGENTAIVVGRDGKISTRETWMDPYRLKIALDEAIAVKPTTMPMD
ncbi:MAG TPA: deiodinase-like protein [Tepidisphaeraceae bacterium]|nr:deiodinase-like protein [Tepidisphaeraceae bacterium]